MVEGFTKKRRELPAHRIDPKGYVISVPLKEPREGIQAVVWNTATLDEAITFVDLLQGGKLKAVTVYSFIPWAAKEARDCVECPIKELVFHASSLKERLEILKNNNRKHTGE
jgi:hypothetical protein